MYSIINIQGGLGKSVLATAVIAALKKNDPERNIIVITAYPDVFLNNPDVYRAIGPGTSYFYETYIRGKDVKFFLHEPYANEKFMKGGNIISTWCDLCSVTFNGEMPKIFLSDFELKKMKRAYPEKIALIQPFGGGSEIVKYSWNRDIPFEQAQEIVTALSKTHRVLQIGRQDQPKVAEIITLPFREMAALIALSDKRVFIDSFAQHTAAALGLPSIVCWITNTPEKFGYSLHKNILARPFDKKLVSHSAYFEEFDFTGGNAAQYPYNDEKVFNLEEIISSKN